MAVAQLLVVRPPSHAMSKHVTQIPVRGSSGETPTGAMQFQGDWPGLFVRGDHAFRLQSELRELLAIAQQHSKRPTVWPEVERIIEIIERDVAANTDPTTSR